jgi:hypothetical protein
MKLPTWSTFCRRTFNILLIRGILLEEETPLYSEATSLATRQRMWVQLEEGKPPHFAGETTEC